MSPAPVPVAEGVGGYAPLPEGSVRACNHCGAPARYIRTPTSVEDAERRRPGLCERCYRGLNPGNEEVSILDNPATWNPPEGDGAGDDPQPIPAIYVAPPEPDLPDLPQPDDVAGLDEGEVWTWVNRLCAAEVVRSPGTRYAEGLPPAALRAELRADLGDPQVQQAWGQYRAARRQAWERESSTPRYEGENRRPALEAESLRLAAEGYNPQSIYHGLLLFNQNQCVPPLYEVPPGSDGEVQEIHDLAESTYQSLPLSALRVEEMPQRVDAMLGDGKIARNDRRGQKLLHVIQLTNKDGQRDVIAIVANVALESVAVRVSPRGGVTRYECTFVGLPRTRVRITGTFSEIAARLVEEGFVTAPHLLQPTLAALIQHLREHQWCLQTAEEQFPGFYPAKYRNVETLETDLADGLTAVDLRLPPLNRDDLRRALTTLDWIVREWSDYAPGTAARMSLALRWHLVAPFSFVRRHLKLTQDLLVLHGSSQTGKSVAGQIGLSIWNRNDTNHRISNGAFNTEARVGESLARGTFQVVVDEADLTNESIHEILKNVWESLFSRTPLTVTRQQIRREAYAVPCLTTNKGAPVADAIRNRCAVLEYKLYDRDQTLSKGEQFSREALPRLPELPAIGAYVAAVVMRTPAVLEERDWVELGTALLTHAYSYAGLAVPGWVELPYSYRQDTVAEAGVAVALALRDLITRVFSQEFSKYRALFADRADRGWETEIWDLPQKMDLLLATGSIGSFHSVRRSGVGRLTVEAEIERASEVIEAVRIDAGIFNEPEIKNSPEVISNLHGDLGNLARILGVEKPKVQNLVGVDGKRTKRVSITIPKAVLVSVIENATGSTDDL